MRRQNIWLVLSALYFFLAMALFLWGLVDQPVRHTTVAIGWILMVAGIITQFVGRRKQKHPHPHPRPGR